MKEFYSLSSADEEDCSFTKQQFNIFNNFIKELQKTGIDFPVKHCSNSAGFILDEKMHINLIRPGIIIYGLYPSNEVNKEKIHLKPAMSLKSQVVFIKEVEEKTPISYVRKYITSRKTKVATIPVGYADGYSRRLSSLGRVLINGIYAPIIGNICMDQFMVDVSHIPDVDIGSEVVLIGQQGENVISAEEIADIIGTINYEVVCMVGKRIPRVYIENKEVLKRLSMLMSRKKRYIKI